MTATSLYALAGLLSGWLLGRAYFAALDHTLHWWLAGQARRAIALQAVRLGLLALALAMVAKLGALPLLCALAGILLARARVLRSREQTS